VDGFYRQSFLATVHSLFFALVGPNVPLLLILLRWRAEFCGGYIILQNVRKSNFVVETLHALQQFAAYYRSLFEFPVIGLTGSNGRRL
jgi:alanine racemase